MSVDAKVRNRRTLGLALANWSSVLTLIPAAVILFSWFKEPKPLFAEASRLIYAPSAALMIALAIVGWFMAGGELRKERRKQARAARIGLALSLVAYVAIAWTAMRAEVLCVRFQNETGKPLSEFKVKVFDEEYRFENVAAEQDEVWLVLDHEGQELDVDVFVRQIMKISGVEVTNLQPRERLLDICCGPELDITIETKARPD